MRVYICLCLYQTLVVPVITLGYVGFDCLFTNLAFHITAQFGILSYTIKEILDDPNDFQCNMKKLVLRHYKLIRQAETLEDNFNVLILQQLMGSTFQLCISGYNTLLDSVKKEGLTVVIFYSYAFCVMSTLFTYCYIGECLIQEVFLVPTIILGYVGFDCLFANLAFHITAQFGVLSCMLREILDDSNGFRCNIKELVLRHYKLIRQAKILEDKYNVIIFQQLMGSTFQLCASGYNTLVGSVNSQTLTVMVFNFYASNTLCTLFTYCYIGECLIQESLSLNTAIYRYEWYNVSPINLKMVNICMLRMKKPEQLTSGKFFVLSLASFTDMLIPPCVVLGFVGFDCLFTNLAFHITAQFGVLSCMLRDILDNSTGFRCNIKELVLRHYKLIRQAKTLEDKYNVIILQQLMGSTFQLCASGYYTLLERIIRDTLIH
ncbi:odorant receptor 82a-like [Vespula maculifrons]|uniref:Odorant receptor n=1 Tax=Vespula maculifrons TaxID=7453 RepID=A0ABD2BPG9_VESMC